MDRFTESSVRRLDLGLGRWIPIDIQGLVFWTTRQLSPRGVLWEMYVLQVRSGVVRWNDLNCSRPSRFICEKGKPCCLLTVLNFPLQ